MPDKCIYCVAPHTSNWDFALGELFYNAVGGSYKPSFLIKKEWFKFPFGVFFRWAGGVPVDRNRNNSIVRQMIDLFNEREQFCLAVTPEATRKANPNWKKGFYYMAKEAGVPILLVYFDYSKKELGADISFTPTDDEEKDMQFIKQYYSQFKGRYPENFAI